MSKWWVRLRDMLLGYIQPTRIIEDEVFRNEPLVIDRPTIVRKCKFYGCGIICKSRIIVRKCNFE